RGVVSGDAGCCGGGGAQGGRRRLRGDGINGPADPFLAFAPDGLQLDPARGDVDGAERAEEEAFGAAATVTDQIDLEEARPRIVPLGEGADGDVMLEPGAGPRDGGAADGTLRPGERQPAGIRPAAGLAV